MTDPSSPLKSGYGGAAMIEGIFVVGGCLGGWLFVMWVICGAVFG